MQDWGAPARCRVQVQPALNQFIGKCAERGMVVGLSTWFRKDLDDTRMKITTPARLGGIWKTTLDSLNQAEAAASHPVRRSLQRMAPGCLGALLSEGHAPAIAARGAVDEGSRGRVRVPPTPT